MNTSQMTAAGFVALTAMTFSGTSTVSAQIFNPVVSQTHSQASSYDPFADHHTISQHTTSVLQSAYDPYRNHIDPGSYRYVNRYTYDRYGRLIREYGYTWTSYGRPHGKLTRVRVTHYPGNNVVWTSGPSFTGGTTQIEGDTVIRSRRIVRSRPSVTVQQSHGVRYYQQ